MVAGEDRLVPRVDGVVAREEDSSTTDSVTSTVINGPSGTRTTVCTTRTTVEVNTSTASTLAIRSFDNPQRNGRLSSSEQQQRHAAPGRLRAVHVGAGPTA